MKFSTALGALFGVLAGLGAAAVVLWLAYLVAIQLS